MLLILLFCAKKHLKSIFPPAVGVQSTQTLVEIYNNGVVYWLTRCLGTPRSAVRTLSSGRESEKLTSLFVGSYKSASIAAYKRLLRQCFRRCFGSLSAGSCGRHNRRAAVEEETAFPLLLRPFSINTSCGAAVDEPHRKQYTTLLAYCGAAV